MRRNKNIVLGLFIAVFLFTNFFTLTGLFFGGASTVYAAQPADQLANAYCNDPVTGLRPTDVCIRAFVAGYEGRVDQDEFCQPYFSTGICGTAYARGEDAADPDRSQFPSQCQGWDEINELQACKKGVEAKLSFEDDNPVCDGYTDSGRNRPKTACFDGYRNTNQRITEGMKEACKDHKSNNTYYNICLGGYYAATQGKSQRAACEDKYNAGRSREACIDGFKGGKEATEDQGDDTSKCVANGSTTLEWILCPVITALSKAAEAMNGFIIDQLNFETNKFLPKSGENAGVYKAWTIFKNLVTAALVIIMLVMVISQALGTGAFEAYTIKKILPRLVIAVIGIQLSWELCIFIIKMANSLGLGLSQIMAAPFGGPGNLDLGSLLNRLGGEWAAAGSATLTGAFVVGAFLTISNPAGALLVVFSVVLAVIIALATILFRNVLIIALVVLAPVALLLWIMPNQGLRTYWKMWQENFTKALMLFPMMIGLIYAGRIFAFIAGGASNVGFINFIMILVGFFGPYYLLPKSFKWGGSLMSQGSNAIGKGGDLFGKKPREYLSKRKEEWDHERKRQSQQRVSEGNPSWFRGDQFRSGKWDPLYNVGRTGRRLKEAHVASYEAGGASAFEEENKQIESSIEAREKGLNERATTLYRTTDGKETDDITKAAKDSNGKAIKAVSGDKDDLVQAIAKNDNSVRFKMVDGRELTIKDMFGHVEDGHVEAALGRMASLGGNPNLTALNSEVMKMMDQGDNPDVQRRLNRFLGRYAGNMFGKMPHWYKGVNGAANGLSPEALSGVSGASMAEMLTQLETKAKGGDKSSAKDLATLLRTWGEAADNPNIAGRIDKSAVQRLSDFLQPNRLNAALENDVVINAGDAAMQQDTHNVIGALKQKITPTGDIRRLDPQQQAQTGQAAAGAPAGPPAAGAPTAPTTTGAPTPTVPQGAGGAPAGAGTPGPGTGAGGGTGGAFGSGDFQRMTEALQENTRVTREAAEKQLGREPGEIRIEHGPAAPRPDEIKRDSGIIIPGGSAADEIRRNPPPNP